MTLLDAKEYHPEKERKKRTRIISAIVLVLLLAFVGWWNRFWPEKRIADKFFSALQKQDFETAYGIYYADPDWKQHPQNHAQYPFNEFRQDWGPGGEWGIVKSYQDLRRKQLSRRRKRSGGRPDRERSRATRPVICGQNG